MATPFHCCDADACPSGDDDLVEGHRTGQRGSDRRKDDGLDRADRALQDQDQDQDQDELVTTDPCDEICGADAAAQARGHLAEQLVPGVVAVLVVHGLEVVEVEVEDHRTG